MKDSICWKNDTCFFYLESYYTQYINQINRYNSRISFSLNNGQITSALFWHQLGTVCETDYEYCRTIVVVKNILAGIEQKPINKKQFIRTSKQQLSTSKGQVFSVCSFSSFFNSTLRNEVLNVVSFSTQYVSKKSYLSFLDIFHNFSFR